MGFAHALAVLYAVLQLPTMQSSSNGLSLTRSLPFPHLQQRLLHSLPGVVVLVAGSVVLLWGIACLWPLQSVYEFPGIVFFAFVVVWLVAMSLVHVLLRYVMVPGTSSSSSSLLVGGGKSNSAVYGWLQTSICIVVELVARIHQEPQLLVLLTLSLFHVWLVKTVVYWGFVSADSAELVSAQFNAFATVGGVVWFVSFVSSECCVGEDPFVLDRRSILETVVIKDVVRALRRGFLVYFLARVVLFVARSDDVAIFAFRFDRALFQITTSAIDSFVLLSAASIFRVLLFRPNYNAISDAVVADGSVWDTLSTPRVGSQSIHDSLFGGVLAVSSQNAAPLADQFVVALKKRMDAAVKQVTQCKVRDFDASFDQVEALETQLQFSDLMLATKFDAATRQAIFASEPRWKSFVRASTSVLDCFTLTLQLLNTIPERKNATQEPDAAAVEKSVSTLVALLVATKEQHPLFVLHAHPHLSNLRISSTSFKSKIQYYCASRVQFALRRFIVEEARRRVFVQLKAVHSAQQVLCHLVSASRTEDSQGNVQHTVPAVLSSLLECRIALETYIDISAKIGNAGDAYEREAKALARGIDQGIYRIADAFNKELSTFSFAPRIKKSLESYTTFNQ